MVVSPSVAADILKGGFRKATIVAFRETTLQLSTTIGTLPMQTFNDLKKLAREKQLDQLAIQPV